jgi:hypothetical protein
MSDHADPVDSAVPIAARMTFIVRLDTSETEGVSGIVEHASTGWKERFRGVEAISGVIAGLMHTLASSHRDDLGSSGSTASGRHPQTER